MSTTSTHESPRGPTSPSPRPAQPTRVARVVALSCCLALPATLAVADRALPSASSGQAPHPGGDEVIVFATPEPMLALRDCVPVRREPGFVNRETSRLVMHQQVMVDRRQGDWFHIRDGGWVQADQLGSPSAALHPSSFPVLVTKEGARVRSGPSTESAVVRTLSIRTLVEVIGDKNGWWQLAAGGFLSKQLAQRDEKDQPLAVSAPARELPASGRPRQEPTHWSLVDINGLRIDVGRIPTDGICDIKRDLAASGLLQSDWSLLRLRIQVPEGDHEFAYSPDTHAVLVIDKQGQRFPSIRVQGPIEKLPIDVRRSLEPRTIHSGETHDGVLLFRPALQAQEIAEIWVRLGDSQQRLFLVP